MIFLRLLCLMAGVVVLVAPPVMLFPTGASMPNVFKAAAVLCGLLLASSGFFLVGMAGHRMRRSPRLRSLAAVLLAVPFAASVAMFWRSGSPTLLSMCSMLLCFTALLYLSFIYPVLRAPGYRPPRGDEMPEPQLNPLPPG
ncbi:hypothetical protein [Massilia niastensis]|uniref:hypothetical protein n=1 Tax=Massilia niastensis TaxID=544911 RepID=UPI000379C126|nr:hypothetical protein [Massilia niastensis]